MRDRRSENEKIEIAMLYDKTENVKDMAWQTFQSVHFCLHLTQIAPSGAPFIGPIL